MSGVSVHTLSNLETGVGHVTLDTLLKVVTTLGFKVRVGVGGSERSLTSAYGAIGAVYVTP